VKADSLNAKELFGKQVSYVIPAFQRPYVWTKDDQWEPMWEDVQDAAERYLEALTAQGAVVSLAAAEQTAGRHFLGAIVVKQEMVGAAEIETREVIDGQQRMTTMQLLIDAAQEVAEDEGWEDVAYNLRHLVRNDEYFARKNPEKVFKVWPTMQDRDAFRAVMTNGAPTVLYSMSGVVQCHQYFKLRIIDWVHQAGQAERPMRAKALETALLGLIELVVIDLGNSDDAFVIFETLNARGTPLRASDLVKNFLLQSAVTADLTPDSISARYWRQFDDPWWQQEVRQGRLRRPRVDTFVDYWLEARAGREVQSYEVFRTFKSLVEDEPTKVLDLAQAMADAAKVYRSIEEINRYTRDGTFVYRWDVLDARVVTPLLLWVFSLEPSVLPPERRTRLLVALESYLVRRMVARMTTKQYNRLFLDVLAEAQRHPPGEADEVVIAHLAKQTADSQLWPGDAAFRAAILDLPVYSLLSRSRVRMFLEALEDDLRGTKTEDENVTRGKLTIEHVLPQTWQTHWPLPESEDSLRAELDRNRLLQTFGNLTLVTQALNPELSNLAWPTKRRLLEEHAVLLLTRRIVKDGKGSDAIPRERWDEEAIRARGDQLFQRALEIWPRP